jgi:hypothetical protein
MRLEGYGLGSAARAAMVRDARASPALLTIRAERVKLSVQNNQQVAKSCLVKLGGAAGQTVS